MHYLSELSKKGMDYLSELSKNSRNYLSELSNFLIFVLDNQVLFVMQDYIQRNIDIVAHSRISEKSATPTLKLTMPCVI